MSFTFISLWRRLARDMNLAQRKPRGRGRKARNTSTRLQVEELEPRLAPTASVVNVPPNVSIADYRVGMTGVNANESILTPVNVNSGSFGKQWDNEQIQGQVYAQPIYLPNLAVTVNGVTQTQNTLLVATEANMLYWINADTGATIQSINFDNYGIPGATTITPVPSQDVGAGSLQGSPTTHTQIYPQIGITSTPLFANGLLYLVAYKKEVVPGEGLAHYVYDLEVVDVSTRAVNQTQIADTGFDGTNYTFFAGDPIASGNGVGSIGGVVYFNAKQEGNRPEISMTTDTAGNQDILLGFEGHDDVNPYHGWEIAVNASTLEVVGAFCTTPNGSEGGIWRSSISDGKGDIWIVDGNGTFDTQLNASGQPINGDYGDSVIELQLTPGGFNVADYFTPSDQQTLDNNDLDLDAGGLTPIYDAEGNLATLVSIGKDGTIYVLNPFNMGGFDASGDQVIQELPQVIPTVLSVGAVFCESAFFNNTLFVFGAGDQGEAFQYTPNAAQPLSSTPTSVTAGTYGYPGAVPEISANGSQDGIVWTLNGPLDWRPMPPRPRDWARCFMPALKMQHAINLRVT